MGVGRVGGVGCGRKGRFYKWGVRGVYMDVMRLHFMAFKDG